MSTTISFLDLNNFHPLDSLNPDNLKEISQKLEVYELKEGDSFLKVPDPVSYQFNA